MRDNKPGEFYDEALRALWGYVGDKLNISVEQLSRENIAERLAERQVDSETIGQFLEAIDECEFERYAPGDPKGNMEKVYDKAITAIEKIFTEATASEFQLEEYDFVIDAIDSLSDKMLLIEMACRTRAKLFSSMDAALKMDPTRIQVAEFWKVKGDP